jgi:hypothetical protein
MSIDAKYVKLMSITEQSIVECVTDVSLSLIIIAYGSITA